MTKPRQTAARVAPVGAPPGIKRLVDQGRARWSGRTPRLPEPLTLEGDGPLASDYVREGRR
jgi:hypothetical protein